MLWLTFRWNEARGRRYAAAWGREPNRCLGAARGLYSWADADAWAGTYSGHMLPQALFRLLPEGVGPPTMGTVKRYRSERAAYAALGAALKNRTRRTGG